ncbi:MAG: response regulator [bacterium]|nr:response regulator [bacterium]
MITCEREPVKNQEIKLEESSVAEAKSPGRSVIVVDDEEANLKVLARILKIQGHRVRPISEGQMALASARSDPPDLVILDINMPGMNGYEVCREMKEDERLKDIPVLFLSGMGGVEDKVEAFRAGGVDYITKPFQFEEIQARVETHLKLRQLQVELEYKNDHLQDLVREQVRKTTDSQMATIFALAKLADSRDSVTGKHIERVQAMSRLLASHFSADSKSHSGTDSEYIEDVSQASTMHDIGKVGVRDLVLLKPGPLTPEEFEEIKVHTTLGASTLKAVTEKYPGNMFINMGMEIALSHHEKWDGTGYPQGLSGKRIPLSARIVAVADVYDALTSHRPYRSALEHEQACALVLSGSGRHFDPRVTEVFGKIKDEFRAIRENLRE